MVKCKNCGHKLIFIGQYKDGSPAFKHIWENELGYCQSNYRGKGSCGCDKPER